MAAPPSLAIINARHCRRIRALRHRGYPLPSATRHENRRMTASAFVTPFRINRLIRTVVPTLDVAAGPILPKSTLRTLPPREPRAL